MSMHTTINLLPQEAQRRLRREFWLRFSAVVLVGILLLELFAVALFTPTYYALHVSTRDLAKSIEERKKLVPAEDASVASDLAAIKKEIAQLKPTDTTADLPPSVLLDGVVREKPPGIAISALAYVRGEKSPSLQLSGIAETQEDLLAFRRIAQANPQVLDFKYSTSFITTKADIPFSATITFK